MQNGSLCVIYTTITFLRFLSLSLLWSWLLLINNNIIITELMHKFLSAKTHNECIIIMIFINIIYSALSCSLCLVYYYGHCFSWYGTISCEDDAPLWCTSTPRQSIHTDATQWEQKTLWLIKFSVFITTHPR